MEGRISEELGYGELIIDNNIFESFYKKIFDYFINDYGNLDDWELSFFIVELQALDLNRNVIFQYVPYEELEGWISEEFGSEKIKESL